MVATQVSFGAAQSKMGNAWRRIRAAALVAAGLIAAPYASTPALAASADVGARTSFQLPTLERAVEDAFTRMERVMRPCVQGRDGRQQIDVRYIGIPSDDPRISSGLRDEINARFVSTINQISPYVANPYEVNRLLPKLAPGTTVAGERLIEAINEQVDSPMVAIVEPSRPTASVLSLKFQLLGRGANGVFGCPQERLLHLELPTLAPTDRPPVDLDLRVFDGFVDAGLSHLGTSMADLPALSVSVSRPAELQDTALCQSFRDLLMQLRARYYRFRRNEAVAALGAQRLPGLTVIGADVAVAGTEASDQGARLTLQLTRESEDGIFFAGLVLSNGTTELDASFSRIVLDDPITPDCFALPKAPDAAVALIDPTGAAGTDGTTGATDGSAAESGSTGSTDVVGGPPPEGACIVFVKRDDVTREECLKPGDIFRDCEACPEMVVIAPGTFTMGSPSDQVDRNDDEGPQKYVDVFHPFALSRFETTRDEFNTFIADSGYKPGTSCYVWLGTWRERRDTNYASPGFDQVGDHPAVCMSHEDADAYVAWLNGGLQLDTVRGYRLPSEAEWEYAARAGETGTGWSDETDAARSIHFRRTGSPIVLPGTMSTGSLQPNAFGLYDMLGNAWEWVADCWIQSLDTIPGDGLARTRDCTYATHNTLRGGSWNDELKHNRLASRSRTLATARSQDVGFRIAKPLFYAVPAEVASAPAGGETNKTAATAPASAAGAN